MFSPADHSPRDLHPFASARRVFHHDHGIGAGRRRSSGHDGRSLARRDLWNLPRSGSGFYFSDYVQRCRQVFQISCAHCISIARSPGKRREVTIGVDGFGQHPATCVQQSQQFAPFGAQKGSMFLNHTSCFFEAEKAWLRCHAGMIREPNNWKRNKNKKRDARRYFCLAVSFFAKARASTACARAISGLTVPLFTSRSSSASIPLDPPAERISA